MAQATELSSTSRRAVRRPPLRLGIFVLFSCIYVFVVVAAALGILQILGVINVPVSNTDVEVWGSRYGLDGPAFPWIVGPLATWTVAAAWFAQDGRHFAFVLAAALAWVAFGLLLVVTGSGEGLLVQRLVLAVLLISCRSWFTS
jgi:hypothetical protein